MLRLKHLVVFGPVIKGWHVEYLCYFMFSTCMHWSLKRHVQFFLPSTLYGLFMPFGTFNVPIAFQNLMRCPVRLRSEDRSDLSTYVSDLLKDIHYVPTKFVIYQFFASQNIEIRDTLLCTQCLSVINTMNVWNEEQ